VQYPLLLKIADVMLISSDTDDGTCEVVTTSETTTSRLQVLKGDFLSRSKDQWKGPKSKMMVFVSSPFTDTKVERDVLMKDILPDLRDKGRLKNVEVTFVDMRWGIRDENTADHRTWLECERAIQMCREQSGGLFFLSLQSDK
jgi:hypothetical protein